MWDGENEDSLSYHPSAYHPVLDQVQMDKYELYKEKTILARQLKQQQRRKEQSLELANNMEPRQRVKRVAAGVGTMDYGWHDGGDGGQDSGENTE